MSTIANLSMNTPDVSVLSQKCQDKVTVQAAPPAVAQDTVSIGQSAKDAQPAEVYEKGGIIIKPDGTQEPFSMDKIEGDTKKLAERFDFFARKNAIVLEATPGDDKIAVSAGDNGSLLVDINGRTVPFSKDCAKYLIIDAGDGNDSVTVDKDVKTPLLIAGGAGNDFIIGGSGNDTIYDNSGANEIHGGAGNDVIVSHGLGVEAGNGFVSRLYGEEGNDYLEGSNGRDYLDGGEGNDSIYGLGGDDELYGGAGKDYLDGGKGNDILHAGDGNDTLVGGKGDDQLFGEGGDDLLIGASGADKVDGGAGADRIFRSGAEDFIVADSADQPVKDMQTVTVPENFSTRMPDAIDNDRLESDLEFLASTDQGHKLFDEISATGHIAKIKSTSSYGSTCTFSDGYDQPGVGSDTWVHYNTQRVSFQNNAAWSERAPVVVLYHELVHSYNAATGTVDITYYDKEGNVTTEHKGTKGAELAAVGIETPGVAMNDPLLTENSLRELLGHEERTEY